MSSLGLRGYQLVYLELTFGIKTYTTPGLRKVVHDGDGSTEGWYMRVFRRRTREMDFESSWTTSDLEKARILKSQMIEVSKLQVVGLRSSVPRPHALARLKT